MATPEFVRELRRSVGTALLVLPAVTVLPVVDDRLLVVRVTGSDVWSLIGGYVEPAESPRQAARREAFEETGITCGQLQLVDVVGGAAYTRRYASGDEVAIVAAVFATSDPAGHAAPDRDEIEAVRWAEVGELASVRLSPIARATLSDIGWIG